MAKLAYASGFRIRVFKRVVGSTPIIRQLLDIKQIFNK